MLETIKHTIQSLPNKDFSEFYQEYVLEVESKITDQSIKEIGKQNISIKDLPYLINGINSLTEELKSGQFKSDI